MEKTISYALFLLLVTGLLFTACSKEEGPAVVNEVEVELDVKTGEQIVTPVEEVEEREESLDDSTPPTIDTSDYGDGTYSEEGSYTSPAGPETIGVTLTIEDDIVTNVSIRKDATAEKSVNYQALFADGISALVVGKKLDEIGPFSSVNGSSLTPRAFQVALELIKSDAED